MIKLVSILVVVLACIYFYYQKDGFNPEAIKGKRVLITGASSGIGEHLAYLYSKLGARVFITARRVKLLEDVAKKCKDYGARQVEFLKTDLGEAINRSKVILEVQKRFGGLDHLILNHAILSKGLWLGTRENMTTLLMDMNVNFVSYVDLSSLTLPMLQESQGNIGVVSSIAGKFTTAGFSTYGTTKHAIQGFFSALRQELKFRNTGVSVTLAVIGPVDTDITGLTPDQKKELIEKVYNGYDVSETPENTAVAILRGVVNRKYEIYFGRIAWVMTAIHKMIPGYFEDYAGINSLKVLERYFGLGLRDIIN